MKRHRQVSGFILAGGASSRMGRDKGLLDFGGVSLAVHTARLLAPLVAEVTVVGPTRQYAGLGLLAVPDGGEGRKQASNARRGPLAGIATALAATRHDWNLIVACDLPYLSGAWLDWFLSRAMRSRADIVIPRTEHGLEPLAAVYRRECGPSIEAALGRGVRKVTEALAEFHLDIIDEREWSTLDPDGLVLKNMNSPKDYDEAVSWWGRENRR